MMRYQNKIKFISAILHCKVMCEYPLETEEEKERKLVVKVDTMLYLNCVNATLKMLKRRCIRHSVDDDDGLIKLNMDNLRPIDISNTLDELDGHPVEGWDMVRVFPSFDGDTINIEYKYDPTKMTNL